MKYPLSTSSAVALLLTVLTACGGGGSGGGDQPDSSSPPGSVAPDQTAPPSSSDVPDTVAPDPAPAPVEPDPVQVDPEPEPVTDPEPIDEPAPVVDDPVVEEPAVEEPVVEEPVVEEPQQEEPDTVDASSPLSCGSAPSGITNNELNQSGKDYLLCMHNAVRSETALGLTAGLNGEQPMATNMRALEWDEGLEQVAQDWADGCDWQHNPNRTADYSAQGGSGYVGENIAYQASSIQSSARFDQAVWGMDAFADEDQYWSFGRMGVNDYCSQEPCGHFTQLVWANTTHVGCAVSFCPSQTLSAYPATYLVCNYSPGGNITGRTPYQDTQMASEVCSAASDGETCENGLIHSD